MTAALLIPKQPKLSRMFNACPQTAPGTTERKLRFLLRNRSVCMEADLSARRIHCLLGGFIACSEDSLPPRKLHCLLGRTYSFILQQLSYHAQSRHVRKAVCYHAGCPDRPGRLDGGRVWWRKDSLQALGSYKGHDEWDGEWRSDYAMNGTVIETVKGTMNGVSNGLLLFTGF